jgi:predicted dehydrogenase
MSLEKPAAFALLGCAHPHSRAHLNTLRVSPRVDRIWLWDPDLAAAEALATHAGPKLAGVVSELADALRDDVEFVLACERNDRSPETIVSAARAGKQILSEKPVAATAAALRPVLEETAGAGVALGVCYQWRGHAAAADLSEVLRRGLLGRIMAVEARMVTSQVKLRNPGHWLFDRSRSGGGILSWLGCHWFDLLRFLLQDEVTEVCAFTGVLGGCDVSVEDTASVAMRWASGALGTFTAGYHLARSASGYSGAAYDTYLGIRGQLGSCAWDPVRAEGPVRVETAHPDWAAAPDRSITYQSERSEAYGGGAGLAFFHRFLDDARAGWTPLASGLDALRLLEWLDAVYTSAETGARVAVARWEPPSR